MPNLNSSVSELGLICVFVGEILKCDQLNGSLWVRALCWVLFIMMFKVFKENLCFVCEILKCAFPVVLFIVHVVFKMFLKKICVLCVKP